MCDQYNIPVCISSINAYFFRGAQLYSASVEKVGHQSTCDCCDRAGDQSWTPDLWNEEPSCHWWKDHRGESVLELAFTHTGCTQSPSRHSMSPLPVCGFFFLLNCFYLFSHSVSFCCPLHTSVDLASPRVTIHQVTLITDLFTPPT